MTARLDYITSYSDGATEYEALQIPCAKVEEILGAPHEGTSVDDEALIAWLVSQGYPAWIHDAEGWIDEGGWGLIGPRCGEI